MSELNIKLSIEEICEKLSENKSKRDELEKERNLIRFRCSHKFKNGDKATFATGGGFAWCRFCEQEID